MAQISCFSPGVTGAEGEAHLQRSQGCQRLLSLHRQRPGFEKSSRILEGRPRRCQSAVVFWWFWCRYIYHFSAYLLDLQHIYILVGGFKHCFYFSIYWECHDPNWRTHIFQRGGSTTNQDVFGDWETMNLEGIIIDCHRRVETRDYSSNGWDLKRRQKRANIGWEWLGMFFFCWTCCFPLELFRGGSGHRDFYVKALRVADDGACSICSSYVQRAKESTWSKHTI